MLFVYDIKFLLLCILFDIYLKICVLIDLLFLFDVDVI